MVARDAAMRDQLGFQGGPGSVRDDVFTAAGGTLVQPWWNTQAKV
jgi:hypothetical protein